MTTRERRFKRQLLGQAAIRPGMQVLDLGCGTGTLAIWAKQQVPEATIVGIDGDRDVVTRANEKAARAGLAVRFDEGMSFALAYPDASFERVVSSLFFHHLSPADKARTAAEVHRVLTPGGELHVADWGRPACRLMRTLAYSIQLIDGFESTEDNIRGRLPQILERGGLSRVALRGRMPTVYGTLAFYSAQKEA